MVVFADRDQVFDVGGSTVADVKDVVRFGFGDMHPAPWYRAGAVHGPDRPPLGPVGEADGVAEFEDDTVVVEDHGDDVRELQQAPDTAYGDVDTVVSAIEPGPGMTAVFDGVVVDGDDHCRAPCPGTGACDQFQQGVGLEEIVAGLRVGRAPIRDGIEHCFDLVGDRAEQREPALGVEFAGQADHPGLFINPGPQSDVAFLALQAGDPVVGFDLADTGCDRPAELFRC